MGILINLINSLCLLLLFLARIIVISDPNHRLLAKRYKPLTYFHFANLQINFYIKKFFYYNLDSIFASSNFKNIYYENISKKRLAVFNCVWRSSMVSNANNI